MDYNGSDRRSFRLASQVFERLRADIVSGILAPDTALAELDLCSRLRVSRTPVREALNRLAEEGLVQIFPQFGSFVAPISIEAVRVGQYVRENLECALITDAARKIDAEGLKKIRDNLAEQVEAQQDGDAETFYSLDNAFHATIAGIGGQPGVWSLIEQTNTQFDRVRHLSVQNPDQVPLLLRQHQEIVAALAERDAAKAKAALRRHLREVFATVKQLGITGGKPTLPLRRRRGVPN